MWFGFLRVFIVVFNRFWNSNFEEFIMNYLSEEQYLQVIKEKQEEIDKLKYDNKILVQKIYVVKTILGVKCESNNIP